MSGGTTGTPLDLVAIHEAYVDDHDGSHWGSTDGDTRYRVMLDVIREPSKPATLLDFGCGLSHLLDFIERTGRSAISYSGLDLSERLLGASRSRHPSVTYYDIDVLAAHAPDLPTFDYVILNGIFHTRANHTNEEMFGYLRALVRRMFEVTRVGLAFNLVSTQVEWQRDDLFHVPLDPLVGFLSHEVSRHVAIRHDYGLYEYTAYVYREPDDPDRSDAKLVLGAIASAGKGKDGEPHGAGKGREGTEAARLEGVRDV